MRLYPTLAPIVSPFRPMKFSVALCAFYTLCLGLARAQISPTITEQPKFQVVTVGSPVTLSVSATGTEPLTYEWIRNSPTQAPFATGRTVTISDIARVSSGIYYCRVRNAGGETVSNPAQVTAIAVSTNRPAVSLVTHDVIPRRVGDESRMLAVFTGALPMTYQWFRNGAPIPGEVGNALYKRSVQQADNGTYTITATNSLGSSTSASFFINAAVLGTVPLFVDYSSRPAKLGLPANLRVEVISDTPVTYRWEKNGVTMPGVTGTELIIPNVTSADGAQYNVYASNAIGTNSSGFLHLIVQNPPRLANLSVRSRVGTGLDELTVGFVVGNPAGGNAPFFMVRGVGPSLLGL